MRVLITGHDGCIGAVMAPVLRNAGLDVEGLDSFLPVEVSGSRNVSQSGDIPKGMNVIRSARPQNRQPVPRAGPVAGVIVCGARMSFGHRPGR